MDDPIQLGQFTEFDLFGSAAQPLKRFGFKTKLKRGTVANRAWIGICDFA
jgi:hypothetical protein